MGYRQLSASHRSASDRTGSSRSGSTRPGSCAAASGPASGPESGPAGSGDAPGRRLGLLLAATQALALLTGCQPQAQDASAIPHTPIPKAQARLSLQAVEGRIRYEGVVADEATRDTILGALESATPQLDGTLRVEPRTRPAAWTAGLGAAAAALRETGGRLTFVGKRIELAGRLTQEQRATLKRRFGRLYPGYELAGAFQGADPKHALPETGDAAGLVGFLNARPIEFQPGTGMLAQAGMDVLARAARGLRAAGPAARVELRVHPETGGDASEQAAVARQRAEAVLTQLAIRGVPPGRVAAVVAEPGPAPGGGFVEFALPGRDAGPGEDGSGDAGAAGPVTGGAAAEAGRAVADDMPPGEASGAPSPAAPDPH